MDTKDVKIDYEDLTRHQTDAAALALRIGVTLDPTTLGAVLGLIEGLASDDRCIIIRRRGDETTLDLAKDDETNALRFTGASLTTCLAAASAGPPPEEKQDPENEG